MATLRSRAWRSYRDTRSSDLAIGTGVKGFAVGDRVGIPWLGHATRRCLPATRSMAGYADYTVAEVAYCFAVPENNSDTAAAPLLHAGLIGYRSLRIASAGRTLQI